MIPDIIMNEAIEKANLEIDEVFSLAFIERLREKRHYFDPNYHKGKKNIQLVNGSCQCNYCKSLRYYVELKLEYHRTKKRLYSDTLSFKSEVEGVEINLAELEQKVKKAKEEKDKIKNDLKI